MSVNIKVTGGLNIEWGQTDPQATGGLTYLLEQRFATECVAHRSTHTSKPRSR